MDILERLNSKEIKIAKSVRSFIKNGVTYKGSGYIFEDASETVEIVGKDVYIDAEGNKGYYNKVVKIFDNNELNYILGRPETPSRIISSIIEVYEMCKARERETLTFRDYYKYIIVLPKFMDYPGEEIIAVTRDESNIKYFDDLIDNNFGIKITVNKPKVSNKVSNRGMDFDCIIDPPIW